MIRKLSTLTVACALSTAVLAPASALPGDAVLDHISPAERIGPGVLHREFTTAEHAGQVVGDLVEVDLGQARAELMTPGKVTRVATVPGMAAARDAIAAINGDFFDQGRTGAAMGPVVQAGRPIKSAIPPGRRLAPPSPPGTTADAVFGVGPDGVARIDTLRLEGSAQPHGAGPVGIDALNQYVIPVGGVGLFTDDWGAAPRGPTTCGSDVDRNAPCAPVVREVVIRDGIVESVRDGAGDGPVPLGLQILVGRDGGADELRGFQVGQPVPVGYRLVGPEFSFAVGGIPVLRDGVPYAGLDSRERAPRSAAGTSPDGRRMFLVTVDGRQEHSVGVTLEEFGRLLHELGADDALNLDGGGSSTLIHRNPGDPAVPIVNSPSDESPRRVANAIGVLAP